MRAHPTAYCDAYAMIFARNRRPMTTLHRCSTIGAVLLFIGCSPKIDYSRPAGMREFAPNGKFVRTSRHEYQLDETAWTSQTVIPIVLTNYTVNPMYLQRCSDDTPRFILERQRWNGSWQPILIPLCIDSAKPPIVVRAQGRYNTVIPAFGVKSESGTPRFEAKPTSGVYRLLLTPVHDTAPNSSSGPARADFWPRDAVESNKFEVRRAPVFRRWWGW